MLKIRLVSLDWDFMFPCVDWFDWGHKESLFYIEGMWPMRWGNRHLKTGALAHEHVVVDKWRLKWWSEAILSTLDPLAICVAESHAVAPIFMKGIESQFRTRVAWTIWNFDAHHDISYGQEQELECGNWVRFAVKERRVVGYNLVYPAWRRDESEGSLSSGGLDGAKFQLYYSDEPEVGKAFEKSEEPVILFVCRSGAWTPPWCDDWWIGLLDEIRNLYPFVAKRMSFQEFPEIKLSAVKARKFDRKAAGFMAAQLEEQLDWIKEKEKSKKREGGH